MSLSGWWVQPDVPPSRIVWFVVLLALSVTATTLVSPRRRAMMGLPKFIAANLLVSGVPLAAVIVVRSGFRHAFLEAGRGWWSAMTLSLFWMLVFTFGAEFIMRRLPPISWLLRDLKLANRQGWKALAADVLGAGSTAAVGGRRPPRRSWRSMAR